MKKKLSVLALVSAMALSSVAGCSSKSDESESNTEKAEIKTEDIVLEKSIYGNPVGGFDDKGNLVYGGDPAALVVEDTVYLYTGHDTSTGDNYVIPEWQCYSSKDMVSWTYEGVTLNCRDIKWADNNSAWAGQTTVHYDKESGKDMYYFYFCSWDNTADGKQSIGVAVSDSPTGPFSDIGHSLVKGTLTENESSSWNDIDPTVWIENDESGQEHRYLAWGNGKYYICELNDDMISVKDMDGNGAIEFGTDVLEKEAPKNFTEAPWIYRQKNENGEYYGKYYLFYAYSWREQMAYATTDDLISGEWEFGGVIMEPSATSNTNHMSVIDFGGKTYFIYHNGSLPGGSGYRRVACISEFTINEDGTIDYIEETSTGVSGNASVIKTAEGLELGHYHFKNSSNDSTYPYINILVGTDMEDAEEEDCMWEIVPGLSDEDNDSYVSIEAYNKPGLYLTAVDGMGVRLSQDYYNALAAQQTFKTVKGLDGDGVSFESVRYQGQFVMINESGELVLGDGTEAAACTFYISGSKVR